MCYLSPGIPLSFEIPAVASSEYSCMEALLSEGLYEPTVQFFLYVDVFSIDEKKTNNVGIYPSSLLLPLYSIFI